MKYYLKENEAKLASNTYALAKNIQKKNKSFDERYYAQRFELLDLENQYLELSQKRTTAPVIENMQEYLNVSFIHTKMRLFCLAVGSRNIIALEYQPWLLNEIQTRAEELAKEVEKFPAIAIYVAILNCLQQPQEEHYYQQLKSLLSIYSPSFNEAEAFQMYVYAMNYCAKKINAGEQQYLQEIFELFQDGLITKTFIQNGQLSPWLYKNITVTGCRLKAYDWVKNFLYDYKPLISESFREKAFAYNLAKYKFYLKEYSEVMDILRDIEYADVFYNLDAKAMLLKTYYEMDEYSALYSLMESFRIFVSRKKLVSETHRKNYLNFIKFSKQLSKTHAGDTKRINKIEAAIKESSHIADKNWLLEKLEELN